MQSIYLDDEKKKKQKIEQDVLALEAKKEKLLGKLILKAVLFILFLSCSILNLVFFAFPFQNRGAKNMVNKSFGLHICLCFVEVCFYFVKKQGDFCRV